eukprot:CAMPEP_0171572348 /NCGR_PEP_ID=MMETSP0961-20121227/4082_1 /TAXON_ID=87120 /ORGANISM="Aurantiochytrium limacinum, Strain ATCCMYA-1381" /LENGTH=115 /DNA_ID=CAMNT_0012127203 /DNA_START=44 /DNA_END=391 /DNA_ORIENTATION=+
MAVLQQDSNVHAIDRIACSDNEFNDVDGSQEGNPFGRIIRSKGFIWLDRQPKTKFYWSLAGKSFSVTPAGSWDEDVSSIPRQELVFIGIGIEKEKEKIIQLLKAALVPPSEVPFE